MKTTLKIFKRDLKNIFTNSMAIILAVGIAVLPSLYAWFNIYANWDPYGATGNMQVAVIIEDEGYRYKSIEINVGEKIKESLSANDAIDWQFIGKEEAMKGIESGVYYAGIEIPKGFSKSLTSIVSADFKQPKITYYANEKKNAIATKITDKVVQTVQLEVNESFVTTVINVLGSVLGVVAQTAQNDAGDFIGDLNTKIEETNASIDTIKKTVGSFEGVIKVAETLTQAANNSTLSNALSDTNALLADGQDMAALIRSSVNGLTASADTALAGAAGEIDAAADIVASIGGKAAGDAAKKAGEALPRVTKVKGLVDTVKSLLDSLKQTLPADLPALDKLDARLESGSAALERAITMLTNIKNGAAQSEVNKLKNQITSLSEDIGSFRSDYASNVQPLINDTLADLMDMLTVMSSLISDLSSELPTMKTLAASIGTSVESGADLVAGIDKLLSGMQSQLSSLAKKINGLKDNELVNTFLNISDKNAEQLGAFIACPVEVETQKVYGIENYGSAMAPFYSTLALWVGAMILIAVVKTDVKKKHEIGNVKAHHSYFGRMLTFLLFSVTQALIICIGDLYFLKIQCYHPAKFIFAGVVAAAAFTIFIYSITAAFGDIGKAIGIIFLVVQIGGSGGTFPIDVTPQFFRTLNPFMPFTYVIEAMRECVCGTYGANYWLYLLKLCAYIAIGLAIGLGVRALVKKPMCFFEKCIKKTDLF